MIARRLRLVGLVLVVLLAIGVWAYLVGVLPAAPWRERQPIAPTPLSSVGIGLFVEPEDGRAPLVGEIEAARRSVEVEVYLLTDEDVITALEDAAGRGIAVRVILEEHPFGGAGGEEEVMARLQRAGIDVRWSNPTFRFSHIKMILIDGETAIIMNLNLTRSAFTGNREFGVVTTRPAEVAQARAIFEADWTRTAAPENGPLVVSPTSSRLQLIALIDGAEATLDIYAEVMRDREIIDALKQATARGVRVRLVMSAESIPGDEERSELAAAGADVRVVNNPYIHAKMVLADGERAFVGSQNFTATSLDQNREVGVIITDSLNIQRLQSVFDGDFASAEEVH